MVQGLSQRFLRGLARSPDRVAVRVGDTALSYRDLHERALRRAGAVAAAGARRVGVLADKGPAAYTGLLAALHAGATVVPLRPDFPAARTAAMIEAAQIDLLLTDEASLPAARATGVPIAGDDAPALPEPRPVTADDTAYILFTSGSTGRPKGVPISQGNAAHYFGLIDKRYDFTAQDVFSQTFDLNFDCALFDVFCAWGAGAGLVAVPGHAYRELPAFLAEHRITVWFATPSAIPLVARMGGLGAGALPGLRWSFFAGEALRCDDAQRWQVAAPASTLENLYGPTELTITIGAHRWGPASAARSVNGVVPIGLPHPGHDHLLLGPDGTPTDDDEGELCVTGPQATAGYLDPADNVGRFLRHDGRTWYRTGDRVRRLDDDLLYLGRADAQVQIRGVRVELAEIDHAVRGCAQVQEAVTVATAAEGELELVVFYTGVPTSAGVLARQLRAVLPAGLVPRHYRHVAELPLNTNRKIDRTALRGVAAELVAAGAG
ncbi:AMP-binding protein [Micromonospora sp. FIMYZ51]|uniref:AMP-binding protein n=1 Tax=Micromonospora sp. FIMYZ51 TaxID=3051832 RepID=UPI00311E7DC9